MRCMLVLSTSARGAGMPNSGDDKGLLDLADAIEGLRAELTSAIEKGNVQRERMRFKVTEPVVLEVQVVTTKDAHGKVGWKVVELGGSYTAAKTHKITLKLSPQWWDGTEYTNDFLIDAVGLEGLEFGPQPDPSDPVPDAVPVPDQPDPD